MIEITKVRYMFYAHTIYFLIIFLSMMKYHMPKYYTIIFSIKPGSKVFILKNKKWLRQFINNFQTYRFHSCVVRHRSDKLFLRLETFVFWFFITSEKWDANNVQLFFKVEYVYSRSYVNLYKLIIIVKII